MKGNIADQEQYLYLLDYSSVFRMKIVKEVLGEINGKTAVDIGCGNGSISFLLWFLGAKVHSIDISKKALRATSEIGNVSKYNKQFETNLCQGDANRLPIKGETFDVVCCFETLEHLSDDRTAIKEIERVTKPGGIVILSVPYDARAINEEKSPRRYRWYSFETMKERLGSRQLHRKRAVFWCFPMLKLLDMVKLRLICASLGLLIEAFTDRTNSSLINRSLLDHKTFVRSLLRFYRTKFWRKVALPALMLLLNINRLFESEPYSNDVFVIFRKAD
jgi:ubiquinone/menaquinone biosynthesis C-methylase UbiE